MRRGIRSVAIGVRYLVSASALLAFAQLAEAQGRPAAPIPPGLPRYDLGILLDVPGQDEANRPRLLHGGRLGERVDGGPSRSDVLFQANRWKDRRGQLPLIAGEPLDQIPRIGLAAIESRQHIARNLRHPASRFTLVEQVGRFFHG